MSQIIIYNTVAHLKAHIGAPKPKGTAESDQKSQF